MIVEVAGFHGDNYKSALQPMSSTPTLFMAPIGVSSVGYVTGYVITAVAAELPLLRRH